MYRTHTYGDIGTKESYHDTLVQELQPTFRELYAYHVRLKNIVEKLREKNIGRYGQLTDDEKEFLKPIFESILLKGFCQPKED